MSAVTDVQRYTDLSSTELVRDVEPLLSLILTKFPIMQYIPMGGTPAAQHEHEWFDDQIVQRTSTLTANITAHLALATGITISVADGTIFKVNDQVTIDEIRSVYEITSIATNDLTCTEIRDIALASDAGNTKTIKYNRAVNEITKYDDVGFEGARIGANIKNFTQIFRFDAQVSESEQESARLGGVYTSQDLYSNAVARGFETIAWEFYQAAILGIGQKRTGSVNGFMKGIREFIDVSGGNVEVASGALTLALLNSLSEKIYDDMSALDQLIMVLSTKQNQTLANLDATAIRYNDPQPARAIGNNVAAFIPNISGSNGINVLVDPNLPPDEVWFLDTSRIGMIPLGSRTFKLNNAQTPGTTALQGFIEGEYTLKVRNGSQAHGIIRGLDVPT